MKNLRMRTQLSLAFGALLLCIAVMGGMSWLDMNGINDEAKFTRDALVPQTELAFDFSAKMREAGIQIRSYADTGDPQRMQNGRTLIVELRQALGQAQTLNTDNPGLRATPAFLRNFPQTLDAFEQAINSISDCLTRLQNVTRSVQAEGKLMRDSLDSIIIIIQQHMLEQVDANNTQELRSLLDQINQANTLFDTNEALQREYLVARLNNDKTELEQVIKRFNMALKLLDVLSVDTEHLDGAALIDQTRSAMTRYRDEMTAGLKAQTDLLEANKALTTAFNKSLDLAKQLAEGTRNRNGQIAAAMADDTARGQVVILILLGISLTTGITLTILLTRSITGPLGSFVSAAGQLSAGQFEVRVDIQSGDEIGIAARDINKAFDVVVDKMLWYESMLDAIPAMISVTDMQSRWTFINAAAEKALNKKRGQVLGLSCKDWGTPLCNTNACGVRCLEKGTPSPGGKVGAMQCAVETTFIHNTRGERVGHIELFNDITALAAAQHKAESALTEGMHTAAQRLEGVVGHVRDTVENLASLISQSEQGAADQAASMTQTATAMEEMNATVLEVAKNAGTASELSTQTRQKAENGATSVGRVVQSIGAVQQRSLELKQDMAQLGEHARSIDEIMRVISDIADQTNLLALNAAIEAARAGDAGRGFAVVADEVRKLAEKTMASTTDVGNAIKSIQTSAGKSITQVDSTVTDITRTTELASESGAALKEIVLMVDSSADQVRAIATAAEQQSASSDEINQAVTRVTRIAGQTSSAMQQATQAVDALNTLTQQLVDLIKDMKK